MTDIPQKDTNNGQNLNVISDKDFGRYIKLKLEKLSSASYVVTNFLGEAEPLKWKIREKAIEIVSYINQGQFDSDKGHNLSSHQLLNTIQQIIAFLEMGIISGSVSQMNFKILKQEYESVLSAIRRRIVQSFEKSVEMPALLADTPETAGPEPEVPAQPTVPNFSPHHTPTAKPPVSVRPAYSPSTHHLSLGNKDKVDRQEKIKTFLKGRGWVAIKDIARIIPGVSVKTIQRELSDMVETNVLKKKGERRWSRYMVNS